MPHYKIIAEKLDRRTKRHETIQLGFVTAENFATAKRLATAEWPDRELFICEQSGKPPTGDAGDRIPGG